jgi:hypothetical protein
MLTFIESKLAANVVKIHVDACKRKCHFLRYAKVVIIVESNNPGVGRDLKNHLDSIGCGDYCYLREDTSGLVSYGENKTQPGFITTEPLKKEMVDNLIQMFLKRQVHLAPFFIWCLPQMSKVKDLKETIFEQLIGFTRILEYNAKTGKSKFRYTGKENGGDDDYVMAMLFTPHGKNVFCSDPKYAAHHYA